MDLVWMASGPRGLFLLTCLWAGLYGSVHPAGAGVPEAGHTLEWGAGFHSNLEGEHREIYGAETTLTLGYSGPIGQNGARLMVEVAYMRGSGDEFGVDPTFAGRDASFWVLPFVLGMRTNMVRNPRPGRLAFYGGLGVASFLSGFRDANRTRYRSPGFGLLLELRPEVRVTDRISVWARQRLLVTGNVDYAPAIPSLNHSGLTTQLGWSLRIG